MNSHSTPSSVDDKKVDVPLYHGTSSLFLDDIILFGLGGKNPIAELKILDFAAALLPHLHEHLSGSDVYKGRIRTFELMLSQKSGNWNFQHGQTYVVGPAEFKFRPARWKQRPTAAVVASPERGAVRSQPS